MKKHNLFSRIWSKALRKGTSPTKLVDDLGTLRGEFSYKKYDPKTGIVIAESKKVNTLVNQAKSNLVRLISQSESPWKGTIDPDDLRIQRMRFGNASQFGTPSRLNYYQLNEPSTRANIPLRQTGATATSFAGGKQSQVTIPGESGTTDTILDAYDSNWTPGPNDTKIYEIPTLAARTGYINPPSHETFVVKFYLSDVLVETLTFGEDGDGIVYTRSSSGIPPTQIETVTGKDPVVTPDDGNRDGGGITNINSSNEDQCGTRLFYDYTTGSTGWKLKVEEIDDPSGGRFDKIVMTYEIGKYNVINSVVPKEGYNDGVGTTELERYQGNSDWYPVISGSEYRDCDEDFIDDYSVTFSVNMTGPYGNGDTDVNLNEYIKYSEAFLFNGLDDMFSIVALPNPFDKNEGSAYYISWTILAPIN